MASCNFCVLTVVSTVSLPSYDHAVLMCNFSDIADTSLIVCEYSLFIQIILNHTNVKCLISNYFLQSFCLFPLAFQMASDLLRHFPFPPSDWKGHNYSELDKNNQCFLLLHNHIGPVPHSQPQSHICSHKTVFNFWGTLASK